MSISQVAPAKWKCKNPECGVGLPYNPTYKMDNNLCSDCLAHDQAKRLLNDYKWSGKHKKIW